MATNITKYGILAAELTELEAKAKAARAYLEGLEETKCGLACSACGEVLETEGDFARHFVIAQMDRINRFFNIGECPNTDRGRNIIRNAAVTA